TGADAVAVVFESIATFRLQKDLMLVLLGEAHHLVLDRRTVAWSAALNLTGVHRRPMKVGADQIVSRRSGVSDVTHHLRLGDGRRGEAERARIAVAGLRLASGEVD